MVTGKSGFTCRFLSLFRIGKSKFICRMALTSDPAIVAVRARWDRRPSARSTPKELGVRDPDICLYGKNPIRLLTWKSNTSRLPRAVSRSAVFSARPGFGAPGTGRNRARSPGSGPAPALAGSSMPQAAGTPGQLRSRAAVLTGAGKGLAGPA